MLNKLTRSFTLIASLFFFAISFQPAMAADTMKAPTSAAVMEKVNLNKATAEQLASIKGIGEKKAQAIIDYRTKNGKFTNVDDLVNIKGIGDSTLAKLKPFLSL